jgi:pilus assembly protein CpaB
MKPKTMILMVVAVGCGLAASYMTSKLLAERNQKPSVEEVVVLTAKKKVPKGTVLKNPKEFFDGVRKPKAEAPAQYFRDYNDIRDKKLNKEIKQGVHITPDDVADRGQAVLDIPDGMGAIALKITAVSGTGFYIKPGNKVDVILTTRGENAESKTILRDVLVLAVGDQPQGSEDPNARATIHAQTVTVALTSEDAQLVRVAEITGDLSLMLRKDGDTSVTRNRVMTKRDLVRAAHGLGQNKP